MNAIATVRNSFVRGAHRVGSSLRVTRRIPWHHRVIAGFFQGLGIAFAMLMMAVVIYGIFGTLAYNLLF